MDLVVDTWGHFTSYPTGYFMQSKILFLLLYISWTKKQMASSETGAGWWGDASSLRWSTAFCPGPLELVELGLSLGADHASCQKATQPWKQVPRSWTRAHLYLFISQNICSPILTRQSLLYINHGESKREGKVSTDGGMLQPTPS